MRLFYIGPYKSMSTAGEISRSDLKLLNEKLDVVSRHIVTHTDVNIAFDSELKTPNQSDVILQYCDPFDFVRYGSSKHIGFLDYTIDIGVKNYRLEFLNVMDEIWVSDPSAKEFLENSNRVHVPIVHLDHHWDTSIYEAGLKLDIRECAADYKFLFFASRDEKYTINTIRAYYTEFMPTEPATLIIIGDDSVAKLNEEIKSHLGLYQDKNFYQRIALINPRMSEKQKLAAFNFADCFLNLDQYDIHGVNFVNAIGYNMPIISIQNTLLQHLGASYDKVHYVDNQVQEGVISLADLKQQMRTLYNNRDSQKEQPRTFTNCLNHLDSNKIIERLINYEYIDQHSRST